MLVACLGWPSAALASSPSSRRLGSLQVQIAAQANANTLSAPAYAAPTVSLDSAGKKLQAQHKRLTASLQITSAGQTLKSENVTITQTTHREKKKHK